MSKKEISKTEQALEKKGKAEIKEKVTIDSMSLEAINEFKDKNIYLPVPMSVKRLNKCDKTLFLKATLRNTDLYEELIGEIMGDLITGAYQNRLEAYSISLSEDYKSDINAFGRLQRQRQSADSHLLNIIKVIKDIKNPPIQVAIKQAEQVNLAEQINQSDKQINIASNQQSA